MAAAEDGRHVLTEAEAVEVLAYLVTAARTQVEEAAEYAPMRLLTGAQRLAGAIEGQVESGGPVGRLVSELSALQPVATPTRDRDGYLAMLDGLCVAVAECVRETSS